jgi:hypothetical protein
LAFRKVSASPFYPTETLPVGEPEWNLGDCHLLLKGHIIQSARGKAMNASTHARFTPAEKCLFFLALCFCLIAWRVDIRVSSYHLVSSARASSPGVFEQEPQRTDGHYDSWRSIPDSDQENVGMEISSVLKVLQPAQLLALYRSREANTTMGRALPTYFPPELFRPPPASYC